MNKSELLKVLEDALRDSGLIIEHVVLKGIGESTRIVLHVRGKLRTAPGVER